MKEKPAPHEPDGNLFELLCKKQHKTLWRKLYPPTSVHLKDAHECDWEGEMSIPTFLLRRYGRFCFLWLLFTHVCDVIRSWTYDLWTTGGMFFCCATVGGAAGSCCSLTLLGFLVFWAWLTACVKLAFLLLRVHMFFFQDLSFPPISQYNPGRWTGYLKLPLGVNEYLNLHVQVHGARWWVCFSSRVYPQWVSDS